MSAPSGRDAPLTFQRMRTQALSVPSDECCGPVGFNISSRNAWKFTAITDNDITFLDSPPLRLAITK